MTGVQTCALPIYEIKQVLGFCTEVGLPVTLGEVGLSEASPELILKIAERAVIAGESIHNMPFPVNAEMVAKAIHDANERGLKWIRNQA